MGHPSIGSEGYKPNYPIDAGQIVPGFTGLNPIIFQSTLSQSEQNTTSTSSYNSNAPRLERTINIDITMAYYQLVAKFNEAATEFLKNWNDALEEQSDRVKEYLKSSDYLSKLQAHSTTTIAHNESKDAVVDRIAIKGPSNLEAFVSSVPIEVAYNYLNMNNYAASPAVGAIVSEATRIGQSNAAVSSGDAVNPLAAKESTKSPEIGPEHFLAASLIIGAGITAVAQTTVDPSGGLQVESRIIQDAYSSIIPLQEQNSAVLLAGWFSAMWGTSLLLRTTAENLSKYKPVEGGDTQKIDVDLAKSYAGTLIENLRSPEFNRIMLEMVYKSQKDEPVDKKQVPEKLILQSKIVLLSTALALVAKLDVAGGLDEGWFNELEFEGLLNGKTDLGQEDIHNSKDIKKQLITEINIALSQLSPADSSAIVANLKEYFKSYPSAEKLLNQQKVLADVMPNVMRPHHFEEGFLDQTAV